MMLVIRDRQGFFWKPNRSGYTNRIEEAGLYTQAECDRICSTRKPDSPFARYDHAEPLTDHLATLTRLRDNATAMIAAVFRESEHRCGVRGFAESGDTCPGCAASGRHTPQ